MGRQLIYDEALAEVVAECLGPDWAGRCPNADGSTVPCAGYLVLPTGGRLRGWGFRVPAGAEACPLRALDVTGRMHLG